MVKLKLVTIAVMMAVMSVSVAGVPAVSRAEAAGDASGARRRPDQHAEAIAFARQHHPELAELLAQLREGDPRAFVEAIADIERALERLEKLRDRQPERHAAAVEEWRLSSRIQLVLARLALSKDPLLELELADLVRQRQEIRMAQLRAEGERLEKRIEKIGVTLAEYGEDPAAAVERECRELVRRARKSADGTAAVRKDGRNEYGGPERDGQLRNDNDNDNANGNGNGGATQ